MKKDVAKNKKKGQKPVEKPIEKEEINDDSIYQYFTPYGQDELNQVADVFTNDNMLVNDDKTAEFEEKFAKFVGAKHCVLVPSATLALYSALIISRAKLPVDLRIPDFGNMETFNACIMSNHKPILCDVNDNGTMELRDLEAGIAEHFNGRNARPTVLEVCFEAINKHTKNLLSVYDFGAEKHLTLGGVGGAICTDDVDEYQLLNRFKNNGQLSGETDYSYWGIDLRISELQSAFGLGQFGMLQKKLDTMKGFYEKIKNALKDNENFVFLQDTPSSRIDVYTKNPTQLAKHLHDNRIYAYRLPKPIHLNPHTANLPRIDREFTSANMLYNAGIYLPSNPIMEEKQIDRMISVLQDFKPVQK